MSGLPLQWAYTSHCGPVYLLLGRVVRWLRLGRGAAGSPTWPSASSASFFSVLASGLLTEMVVAAAAALYLAVKPLPLVLVLVHHSRPAPSSALRLPRRTASAWLPRFPSCSTSAPPPFAAVASMDAPPQGYRTNVGICLADPSLTKASAPPPSSTILLLSPTRLRWVLYCRGSF